MDDKDVIALFEEIRGDPDLSDGIAAIKTLLKILEKVKVSTIQELSESLKRATDAMKTVDCSVTSVESGAKLFQRCITLTSAVLESSQFESCRKEMQKNGEKYLSKMMKARERIAGQSLEFIQTDSKILTHSKSRVVLQALLKAADSGRKFQVYVTHSMPDNSGASFKKALEAAGIECTLILDAAMGFIMESVDFVMVGAEGVCQSGGIINKIGTYQMAICAKALNKSFYVLAESFKFVQMYPFNERSLPNNIKYESSIVKSGKDLKSEHPIVDYTPPELITLLFTDLGILSPSAACDVSIQLYI